MPHSIRTWCLARQSIQTYLEVTTNEAYGFRAEHRDRLFYDHDTDQGHGIVSR